MLCPLCKTEMRIIRTGTAVEGDKSPDEQTKVFNVQSLSCRNKKCDNYGKEAWENRVQIYPDTHPPD